MEKPRKNSLSISLPKEVEPTIVESFPVKSLLQFRSVSKTWQSIIDSPSFPECHFSRAETRPGGARILLSFSNSDASRHYLYSVGVYGGRATHHLTFPGDSTLQGCSFLGPVKGLVCFLNDKYVHVCNPSTRKVRILPLCPTFYKKNSLNNSYLYKPYSSYSFGFDSSSRVFKILHIFGTICRDDNRMYNIESSVLTIRTPDEFNVGSYSWRKISSSFPYPYAFRTQGVFDNDSICWVGLKSLGEENIVTFDLREEKFRLTPSPPNGVPSKSKLANVGGNLGIMSFKDYGDFCLELWVYKNCTWVKKEVGSQVALKKKGMNTNLPTFVGNYYTGDMLLSQDVLLHNYVLRPLSGGQRERGIKISGLPGWIDFMDYKKANFRTYNYVESIMPLDFVVRLGDFAMDLAAVKHPKQPLDMQMKFLPQVDVEVNKAGEKWKRGDLVFGDLEEFQEKQEELKKKQESLQKNQVTKKSANAKGYNKKGKVKSTRREDNFKRKI